MDLFVINRAEEQFEENSEEKEKAKLEKVLRQIERKKQYRIRQREKEKQKQKIGHSKTIQPKADIPETPAVVENENIEASLTKKTSNNVKNFTILGANVTSKKQKVERVLPQWLAKPTIISSNLQELTCKVSSIKQLEKSLRKQLKVNGVKYFFPVQAEVIPWLLNSHKHRNIMIPRDVCVSAPTGSGKTLAFVLPIIQALQTYTVRKIRALVILPTQELAEQVFKCFKSYTQQTRIEVGLISGNHLFNAEQNQLVSFNNSFGFISKIDILVCTAGRLVSHIKLTKGFNLEALEFLVIDEADRVLETVQDDWLYHLEKHIATDGYTVQSRKVLNLATIQSKRSPQKLLFSATLTQDPEKIERLSLFQPMLFTCTFNEEEASSKGSFIGKYTTPQELTEKYIVSSKELKPLVLYYFIKTEKLTRTIVFTHSVKTSHRLKILLQTLFKTKLKIEELSSNLKGPDRDSLLRSFTNGEVDILICTDYMARGIDLPRISCVISYSAPKYLKTYIHRVGRTARAGEAGLAVTILHTEQLIAFKNLLKQMRKEIEQLDIDENGLQALEKRYKKGLDRLKNAVNTEDKIEIKKMISKKKATKKMTKNKIDSL